MTGTETELLQLCTAWRTANDRYMSVTARLDQIHEDDQSAADRALNKEVSRAVYEIEERIFETPATTLADLKAKAGVLAFRGKEMGIPVDGPHGASLVADILALGSDW